MPFKNVPTLFHHQQKCGGEKEHLVRGHNCQVWKSSNDCLCRLFGFYFGFEGLGSNSEPCTNQANTLSLNDFFNNLTTFREELPHPDISNSFCHPQGGLINLSNLHSHAGHSDTTYPDFFPTWKFLWDRIHYLPGYSIWKTGKTSRYPQAGSSKLSWVPKVHLK